MGSRRKERQAGRSPLFSIWQGRNHPFFRLCSFRSSCGISFVRFLILFSVFCFLFPVPCSFCPSLLPVRRVYPVTRFPPPLAEPAPVFRFPPPIGAMSFPDAAIVRGSRALPKSAVCVYASVFLYKSAGSVLGIFLQNPYFSKKYSDRMPTASTLRIPP